MKNGLPQVIEHLHDSGEGLTDGQLLARFVLARDEASFAALLHRHGPMVLAVCRRVLRDTHDAEDAFQASFLVLARKAAAVVRRESVGCWLYAVAYHTALAAARANARRRARERQVQEMPHREVAPAEQPEDEVDWRPLLDRELNRLSEKCRAAVVLCALEGQSQRQAAMHLGVSLSTLASRLARARQLLAKRLTARGVALSCGALVLLLAKETASAQVPPALANATARVAVVATGKAALAGVISAPVAALTEGVLKAMFLNKLKNVALVVLALGLGAGIVGLPPLYSLLIPPAHARATASGPVAAEGRVAANGLADGADKKVVGSGKPATKKIDVADFAAVGATSAFEIEVTKADKFSVSVTADDNLLELIKVEKKDEILHIGFTERQHVETKNPLRVAIGMPALKGVNLTGACSCTLKGFESNDEFHAKLEGASSLTGSVKAKTVKLEAGGVSKVKLQGSAKDATLSATGASELALKDFTLDSADVHLTGASHAVVKAKSKLDYHLTGACSLKYLGDPTIGTKESSGASSAAREKDEK
jgi:RNA polymerase sigma factor (sigma-70 family)